MSIKQMAVTLAVMVALTGCGLKGPLYLPKNQPAKQPSASPAVQPTSSTTDSSTSQP